MSFNLADFVADLRDNRYVQFWFFLWILGLIFIIAGLIVFAIQAKQNRADATFRLHVRHYTSLKFPNFRFEVLNKSEIAITDVKCGDGERNAKMEACPGSDSKECMQTKNAGNFTATSDANQFICRVNAKSMLPAERENQTNYAIVVSIVGNQDRKHKTVLFPNDNVEIYLEKTVLEEAGHNPLVSYVMTPIYASSQQVPGQWNINISYESFDVKHWIEYGSYTSMNALADIGGLIFFIWVAHSFVMFFVDMLYPKMESRMFSTHSYANV